VAELTEPERDALGQLPVLTTREGGSGPAAKIQDALRAPLMFLGVGLPDDRTHASNEKVSLTMLLRGAEAAGESLGGLGRLRPGDLTMTGA